MEKKQFCKTKDEILLEMYVNWHEEHKTEVVRKNHGGSSFNDGKTMKYTVNN